jgi:hypothetical protein
MKEEDLIKKLKNTELPVIEMASHRRRLKMELLNQGYLRKRRNNNILTPVINGLKGGINFMLKGLLARQPVWKFLAGGAAVLILALVLIFSNLPLSPLQPVVVTAASGIILDTESIKANTAEYRQYDKILLIIDGEVAATVDQDNAGNRVGTIIMQPLDQKPTAFLILSLMRGDFGLDKILNQPDIQTAGDIIMGDVEVQNLLDDGAVIAGFSTKLIQYTGHLAADEKTFSLSKIQPDAALALIQKNDRYWAVDINLQTRESKLETIEKGPGLPTNEYLQYDKIILLVDDEVAATIQQSAGGDKIGTIIMQPVKATEQKVTAAYLMERISYGYNDNTLSADRAKQAEEIAAADEDIPKMLAQGACIIGFTANTIFYEGKISPDDEKMFYLTKPDKNTAIALIQNGNQYKAAYIDLLKTQVIKIENLEKGSDFEKEAASFTQNRTTTCTTTTPAE